MIDDRRDLSIGGRTLFSFVSFVFFFPSCVLGQVEVSLQQREAMGVSLPRKASSPSDFSPPPPPLSPRASSDFLEEDAEFCLALYPASGSSSENPCGEFTRESAKFPAPLAAEGPADPR